MGNVCRALRRFARDYGSSGISNAPDGALQRTRQAAARRRTRTLGAEMSTSPISAAAPSRDASVLVRLTFVAGLIATLALTGLGAIWPSLFSLFALVALPSPVLFLLGVFKPRFITERPKLRVYLWICVALSVVSWVMEIVWLATRQ